MLPAACSDVCCTAEDNDPQWVCNLSCCTAHVCVCVCVSHLLVGACDGIALLSRKFVQLGHPSS